MSHFKPTKTFLTLGLILAGLFTVFGMPPMAVRHADAASSPEKWSQRCSKPDPAKKAAAFCEVYQSLSVQKTGQRIAEFAIGFPGKNHDMATGVLILPLGILLTEDMHMSIDGKTPYAFRVRYCTGEGCFAFLDLNKALLSRLRAAKKVQVDGKVLTGQNVSISFDLDGFDHALKKL